MRPSEPIGLFEFLQLVAIAMGRRALKPGPASVAIFVAMDGKGTTGRDCVINASRLSAELGLSERQVWRNVHALTSEGWLEQVSKPTNGSRGQVGRRARYRLTRPGVFMSDDSCLFRVTPEGGDVSHDLTPDRVTSPGGDVSIDSPCGEPQICHTTAPESAESSDTSGGSRLTFSAESSDIAESDPGTGFTSGGSTSDGPTSTGVKYLGKSPTARDAETDVDAEQAESLDPVEAPERPTATNGAHAARAALNAGRTRRAVAR